MPAGTKKQTPTRMSTVDSTFAKNSAQAGMTEIQLGQSQKTNRKNDDVKPGQKNDRRSYKGRRRVETSRTQKSITLPG